MSAVPELKPTRLPLVTPLQSRSGSVTGDPKLINAFAERLEDGSFRVVKRQGAGNYQTLAPYPPPQQVGGLGPYNVLGPACGSYYAEDLSLGFTGTVPIILNFVYNKDTLDGVSAIHCYFNGANPTPINTSGNFIFEPPGISCVQYGSNLVAYQFGETSSVTVGVINVTTKTATVASFGGGNPPAMGIVELDSTMYVMDTQAIVYGSALNDASTWPGLNFIQSNSEPGAGVYIAKHYSYVVAMKEFSIEFLYDAANPTGSPLSPVPNSTVLWGCVRAESVQSIGNRIFWLARERQGAYFIAMLDNLRHAKISTPGIDKIVGDPVGPFYSFAFRDSEGHQYYAFTDVGVGYTIVYDIDEKLWLLWNTPGLSYFPYQNFIVHANNSILMQSTVQANVSKVYQLDEDFVVDVAGSFNVDIYTPNTDLNTRRKKTLMRMDFIVDQQPAYLQVRYSDDDFKTYSQFRSVDLNQKRPTLTNCGTFRRRTHHIHHNAPYSLRLEAVELDFLLGV